jgi:hypothetical protein
MSTAFVRQLGAESGVQLNPLVDNSEIPTNDNSDQVFGIIMRSTRGRIDKPFVVDRGNVMTRLGNGREAGVANDINANNEAWIQVVEALNNGAYSAVVQRLVGDSTVKFAVATVSSDAINFTVSDTAPVSTHLMSIKHLDCFNDGITITLRAEEKKVAGVAVANDYVTLSLRDNEGTLLYEFYGSLKADAVDDYGNTAFLEEVIARQTDAVIVDIPQTDTLEIAPTSDAYGYDATNGQPKSVTSALLICFVEGNPYASGAVVDYMGARTKLQDTQYNYAYIASGGTKTPALLAQLAQLAFDTNRQLRFDIPGDLSVSAAIAWVEQLSFGANKTSHLLHAFWAPFKSIDPTNIHGKGYIGTSALNIAYACLRNAATNSLGFAPKNYPVAGREWPVSRRGITQTLTPSNQDLNALARAKINPVVYEVYTGGGRTVFRDSLTCALVESSLKKLISVADMSASVDDAVTRYGKDCLQLPMQIAIKKFKDFLTTYFSDAEASGWLVPSNDPSMGGKAWMFDVRPNAVRPYDRMDVNYSLRYDGAVRQIHVTQTLVK